jgi:hypothetical protein
MQLKWMGSPSPHQNQSNGLHSIVRLVITTFSSVPPSNTIKAMPRFEPVITQLSMVTLRMATSFPSQNLSALDAEVSRQLVTVMFSQGRGGP